MSACVGNDRAERFAQIASDARKFAAVRWRSGKAKLENAFSSRIGKWVGELSEILERDGGLRLLKYCFSVKWRWSCSFFFSFFFFFARDNGD